MAEGFDLHNYLSFDEQIQIKDCYWLLLIFNRYRILAERYHALLIQLNF